MTSISPNRFKLMNFGYSRIGYLAKIHVFFFLVVTSTLSGCATSGGDFIESPAFITEFPDVDVNQIAVSSELDVFRVGDSAEINVYNVEELSSTYVVDRKGNIVFPLIGTVKVAGLNTLSLQERLVESYGGKYLENPSISVNKEGKVLGKVVVDGAVEAPGVFEINSVISLSETIALAQGMTSDADRKEIYIIRSINGERRFKVVDLDEIRQFGAAEPEVIPNDVVFVKDSYGRIAFREFIRTVPLLNTAAIFAVRR